MNRRDALKAAIAVPLLVGPAAASSEGQSPQIRKMVSQWRNVTVNMPHPVGHLPDGWCSHEWMRAVAVHAYDCRGRKIDRVRAIRLEQGGLRVRVLHTTDKGTVKSVLGLKSHDPNYGFDVVEFEAFIEGGCLGSYVDSALEDKPAAYLTWPASSDRPISVPGDQHRAWIYECGFKRWS